MPKTKLAITLDAELVGELDHLVADRHFPNRSQAIETAVAEKIKGWFGRHNIPSRHGGRIVG